MDLFNLSAKLTLDKSEYENGLNDAEGQAKRGGSKIGSALKGLGVAAGAGIVAAGAAVGKLTMDAVNAYGEYEQLVGGVETLFGAGGKSLEEYAESVGKSTDEASAKYDDLLKAQEFVLNRASNAWDSAGISANEYMSTVTSFSASLIQSMNGDTMEAAKAADRALIDMSDNANKMGTNMESIMTAYMGFSKQNYTMLDNLKLGYGGTKTEMERLIKDAAQMTDVQEELGIKVDKGSMSFGNIVNAISVMQKKMGIAETTVKEGASTIQGSTNRMKAAWQNVVTAFVQGGTPLQESVWDFLNSVKDMLANLLPAVESALKGIGEFIAVAVPQIMDMLPGMLLSVTPKFLTAVIKLIRRVGKAVPKAIKGIFDMITEGFQAFGDDDQTSGPFAKIMRKLGKLGTAILNTIISSSKQMFESIGNLITTVDWSSVGSRIVNLLMKGLSTIGGLLKNLFNAAVRVISHIDWLGLGSWIINAIGTGLGAIGTWLKGLFEEGWSLIQEIKWAEVGTTIFSAIETALSEVVEWFTNLYEKAANAIESVNWADVGQKIWDWISGAFNSVVEWFKGLFTDAGEEVKGGIDWAGLGSAILDYIVSAFKAIYTTFKTIFENAWQAIQDINWPEVGTHIWNAIVNIFTTVGETMKALFESAKTLIGQVDWAQLGSDIWNWIVSKFLSIGGWFLDRFEEAKNFITNDIDWAAVGQFIWDGIVSLVKDFANTLKAWATTAWYRVKNIKWTDLGKAIWDGIKNLVQDAATKFKEWLEAAWNAILEIPWGDIGKAIWEGITSHKPDIVGFFDDIMKFWKNTLGIGKGEFTLADENGNEYASGSTKKFKKAYGLARMFTSPTVVPTTRGNMMFGDGVGGEIVLSEKMLSRIAGGEGVAEAISILTRSVDNLSDSLTEKMAVALNQMGFRIDGREFARLVRSV
jgi:phage-related protein